VIIIRTRSGIFAGLERAPATTDCHCRRERIDMTACPAPKWSPWTAAASEELPAASTSPHDPAFMLYTLRQRRYAQKRRCIAMRTMLVTSRNYAHAGWVCELTT